jgi:hypothetical protein
MLTQFSGHELVGVWSAEIIGIPTKSSATDNRSIGKARRRVAKNNLGTRCGEQERVNQN